MTAALLVCTAAVGLLAGCNPRYCEGNPDNDCNKTWDAHTPDVLGGCTSNTQCIAPKPVCDISGTMACVQCLAPDQTTACTGTTPTCGPDHSCHGCSAHSDCSSNACLPDGSCGTDSNVAYIDPAGTDNTMCTKAMPCTKVLKALATSRPFVKFAGTTSEQVTINNQNVSLLAGPGAQLTSTSAGVILNVTGTSVVAIYDLEIANGLGGTGVGISMPTGNTATLTLRRAKVTGNAGGGISASGGTLTVSQSTISNNTGGGISVTTGTFVIVNNFLFANGSATGTIGGISISTTQNAGNRLDLNSFNKNQAQDTVGTAIQCLAGTFTARNNIMSGNGTLTNMQQTGGSCMHAYSIARPGTVPTGTGNGSGDPLFLNTTTGDLHIQTGSPAIGAADPASDLTGIAGKDIDGDSRTNPTDIGADKH